jgi:predicted Zn-dependent protease
MARHAAVAGMDLASRRIWSSHDARAVREHTGLMRRDEPNGPLPLAPGDEIVVVPMEAPPANEVVQIVMDLQREGLRATLGEEVAVPRAVHDVARGQLRAEPLLAAARERDVRRTLGITARDLFSEGTPFVFGAADSPGRAAIVSLFRLHVGGDGNLFRTRVLKESVRLVARTAGLADCSNPRCVMHPADSVASIDSKTSRLCAACLLQANRRLRRR